jgi:transposase-like protein
VVTNPSSSGSAAGFFRAPLLGDDAAGLSPASNGSLCKEWEAEHARFRTRSLRFHKYAYLFVDGVHVSVRLGEDDRLCLLVVIGVREGGVKELLPSRTATARGPNRGRA